MKKKKKEKIRPIIAGFPIAKNAFFNEMWDWKTLKDIL